MGQNLENDITRLKGLNLHQLRQYWESRLGGAPPPLRRTEILRRLLACKLQEKSLGGFSPAARKKLRKIAGSASRNPVPELPQGARLKPGTVMTREWQGKIHQVRVLDEGFEHGGERFASLSEVARRITGTHWSGPLFFGLKK